MSRFVFSEPPRDVLELRADLAAIQMQLALLKLARKYRPDQPRAPAGIRPHRYAILMAEEPDFTIPVKIR